MTELSTQPGQLKTPVLFLVFNRPEQTAQAFEAIRKVKPLRLYVAADGPRENCDGEENLVAKVREIVMAVDWHCEVKTLFRKRNLGCKYAVSSAIDWFFQNEEEGIILEDDIVPVEGFFYFCQTALEKYRNSVCVGMVAGHTIVENKFLSNNYSTKFTTNALVWGWATWRRVWSQYDVELMNWDPSSVSFLTNQPESSKLYIDMWSNIFSGVKSNKINSWAYPFMYTLLKNNMLCVMPPFNLVENIGFGIDATHTTEDRPSWFVNPSSIDADQVIYSEPKIDVDLERAIFEKIYRITGFAKVKHFIKRLIKYQAGH